MQNIKGLSLLNGTLYFDSHNKIELNKVALNIAELLVKQKKILKLSGELFSCKDTIDSREYFRLDRKLAEFLGIRGYGVHLIAYISQKNNYKIWVPKRNKNKAVEPGKWDNTVAGGIKAGENIYSALKRESSEEAGFNINNFNIKSVGTINYNWRNSPYTLRRDTLYLFDMEVEKDFQPTCLDGELEKFKLLNWRKIMYFIQHTDLVKSNCNLVFFNFFS